MNSIFIESLAVVDIDRISYGGVKWYEVKLADAANIKAKNAFFTVNTIGDISLKQSGGFQEHFNKEAFDHHDQLKEMIFDALEVSSMPETLAALEDSEFLEKLN